MKPQSGHHPSRRLLCRLLRMRSGWDAMARSLHVRKRFQSGHCPIRRIRMKRWRTIAYTFAIACCAGQAGSQELTGTLKNIKETGAITLGYRESSIPFSYLDDSQKPIGYAMDICLEIVEAVKKELKLDKLEVKLNPVTSSTRIPLLANGTIDLECGSTTNNAERQKQISFTNTHFLTASRFVSKKANKLDKIDDLKGKSVVSTSGT